MKYKGKYLVYEDGRVFSTITNIWMKPSKNLGGYHVITMCVDGVRKQYKLHNLVAELFIPNPDNKKYVHHIDGNKLNNSVDNLMWVTNEEHSAIHSNNESKVYIFTEETRKKMSEAALKRPPMPIEIRKKISEAMKGVPQSESHKKKRAESKKIPVYQYDKDNNFIKKWKSALDVELETNISRCHIASVCKGSRKTAGGYIWKYNAD